MQWTKYYRLALACCVAMTASQCVLYLLHVKLQNTTTEIQHQKASLQRFVANVSFPPLLEHQIVLLNQSFPPLKNFKGPVIKGESISAQLRRLYSQVYDSGLAYLDQYMLHMIQPKSRQKEVRKAHESLDVVDGPYNFYIAGRSKFPLEIANFPRKTVPFLKNESWKAYNLTVPTMVVGNTLDVRITGNAISHYMNLMALAYNYGMDFLVVGKYTYMVNEVVQPIGLNDSRVNFLQFLPWYIPSKPGVNFSLENAIQASSQCTAFRSKYPHTCKFNQWQHFVPQARSVLQFGLKRFHEHYEKPMIESEVAIHYRCGDIYKNESLDEYGVLPRSYYAKAIPANASKISIVAQSTKSRDYCAMRPMDCFLSDMCESMLNETIKFLNEDFPQAEINVYTSDTVTESFTRLSNSKYLICSLSTFCFWAGVASRGHVWMPKSEVLVNMTDYSLMGDSFTWIENAGHLKPSHFKTKLQSDIGLAKMFLSTN